MSLNVFLEKIANNTPVSFAETIAVISENYHYQPTEFSNGLHDQVLTSAAGANEGSCKIFAFAKIHQLNVQQTLNLFGDYYRVDVLNDATGDSHQNIRQFMKFGWDGISFTGQALQQK
ncbi:MAG: HopJ type III effector protein [Methylococcales bacterium]